uniref:Cytochrome c biogenesis protein CcsA n=1 Tax=Oltmannsiellopsis viridis TaxID=51324 RepID=Q20EY0_OLTVI|nr:cytochrome c biogenesis protein [Oltmannsiellopsis viridis]ABB81933.1 heme attachment to plastid cytochrome c [Oltmannsiellopsis viridis]
MQYSNFESFFSNSSFTLLFLLMGYFWYNTVILNPKPLVVGKVGMVLSNVTLAGLLLVRWLESSHFPLSNLYESLIFLAWSFTLIHLILDQLKPNPLIGSIVAPSALLTSSFANFSLPEDMQKVTPLVPALQSNWLMMHVTVMILSYAALIAGSLLAIMFLAFGETNQDMNWSGMLRPSTLPMGVLKRGATTFANPSSSSAMSPPKGYLNEVDLKLENVSSNTTSNELNNSQRVPSQDSFELSKTIDNLSYRSLSIGFCFLTIGIISGAVWANEAWGSYWSWDPKETWALITWFVFATYLHIRLKYGWEGKKPAFIASGGFFVIWICYLGVNLFGKGLHTYGFWN